MKFRFLKPIAVVVIPLTLAASSFAGEALEVLSQGERGDRKVERVKEVKDVKEKIPNPLIDSQRFRRIVVDSAQEREKNRMTEKAFLKAMKSGEYILLDARSAANFNRRHIKGAVNLPFTEFTEESLKKVIPEKERKVLIYCNNNFLGSPVAFASKIAPASLNLSTQASLRAYGYENIYELGPLLNVETTSLPFEGTEVEKRSKL